MSRQSDYLAQVYAGQTAKIREELVSRSARLWGSLPTHQGASFKQFLDATVPLLQAGRLSMENITRSYVFAQARALGLDTAGLEKVETGAASGSFRGVSDEELLGRAQSTVNGSLARGNSYEVAVQEGKTRLESILGTELQLAKTHAFRNSASRISSPGGELGYRRVLTGRENCALCMIASTQRYWVGDLLPIHPGCDCDVALLEPSTDLSQQVLDQDLLERTHEAIEGKVHVSDRGGRAPDYRKLIVTYDHGEIGPVLSWKEHQHTVL